MADELASQLADDQILKPQRLAMMAVVNHDMATNSITRKELLAAIKSQTGRSISEADFNNFLRTASTKGASAIYAYYKAIVSAADYQRKAPVHIKRAIAEAFDIQVNGAPVSANLINVLRRIADVSHDANQSVARTYEGVWNVFRYSGHQGESVKADGDPFVTRAAMQIFSMPDEDTGGFTPFKIHYRPRGQVVKGTYYTVTGCIVPLKQSRNMVFIGYEKETDSPLDLLADKEIRELHDPRIEEFKGIVKRRHEWGHFMVARVCCIRETSRTLDDLTPNIGMFRQSELTEHMKSEYPNFDMESLYKNIENRIPNGGKASLRL